MPVCTHSLPHSIVMALNLDSISFFVLFFFTISTTTTTTAVGADAAIVVVVVAISFGFGFSSYGCQCFYSQIERVAHCTLIVAECMNKIYVLCIYE